MDPAAPVLFLDFDGVVARVMGPDTPGFVRINGAAIQKLNPLVMLGVRFILSPRRGEAGTPSTICATITKWMREKGFQGELSGATPVLPSGHRGEEIQAWLDAQPVQPRAIAIVDDHEPMGHLTPRTVYTDESTLITTEDVIRLTSLLTPLPNNPA